METATPVIQEFDYRPNAWLMVGLFLLAFAGAVMLGYFSFFVEGGANVRGIQLTEGELRWLFRILFILSPLGLIPLGGMVFIAFVGQRRIAITHDSLLCPKPTRLGLSSDEIEIRFSDITAISVSNLIGSTRILRIEHAGGAVCIASNMFPSKRDFDQVVHCVESAVDGFRGLHSERI